MTLSRLQPLALAGALVLLLSGCSVSGDGAPGVAAIYRDRVVTNDDVNQIYSALDTLYSRPHPGEDLTLLLIGPEAVSIAQSLGVDLSDPIARQDALLWMSAQQGAQVEPDATVLEVTREVRAIAYIINDPDGLVALLRLVQDVEENTIASPRYGTFSLENFSDSIGEISDYLANDGPALGPAQFIAYRNVDGFTAEAPPEWFAGG
jgi:hypothetical protein